VARCTKTTVLAGVLSARSQRTTYLFALNRDARVSLELGVGFDHSFLFLEEKQYALHILIAQGAQQPARSAAREEDLKSPGGVDAVDAAMLALPWRIYAKPVVVGGYQVQIGEGRLRGEGAQQHGDTGATLWDSAGILVDFLQGELQPFAAAFRSDLGIAAFWPGAFLHNGEPAAESPSVLGSSSVARFVAFPRVVPVGSEARGPASREDAEQQLRRFEKYFVGPDGGSVADGRRPGEDGRRGSGSDGSDGVSPPKDLLVAGQSVVELGAGCGLVGIAVSLMGAGSVTLTDLEYCQANLEANVERNRAAVEKTTQATQATQVVRAAVYDWFRPSELPGTNSFDTILAADVLWLSELARPLCESVLALFRERKAKRLVMAHQTRGEKLDDSFLEILISEVGCRLGAVFAMSQQPQIHVFVVLPPTEFRSG